MNAILNIGKYMYAIPFAVFGLFHFMNAKGMAGMAFGSEILVYVTGVALIAAAVSMVIGKLDKLAATLLGVMLLIFALSIHLPGAIDGDQASTSNFLKDFMLSGAAWMYASTVAKDPAVVG